MRFEDKFKIWLQTITKQLGETETTNEEQFDKTFFYQKACEIFDIYFLRKFNNERFKKKISNAEFDENGIPDYFPVYLKQFINDLYILFQDIVSIHESFELADIITATPDENTYNLYFINCSLVLTKVFLGKVRCGKNITAQITRNISKYIEIPDSFKKLCRIQYGNYYIFNTDWETFDFKIAVLDLMRFTDIDNKTLFNNKINQYLKKLF